MNIKLIVGLENAKNQKNYPKIFKNNEKWLFLQLFFTYFKFCFHFYFLTYQIYCLHAKTGCFLKKICHVDLKKKILRFISQNIDMLWHLSNKSGTLDIIHENN